MHKSFVTAAVAVAAGALLSAQDGRMLPTGPVSFTTFAVNMSSATMNATATVVDLHVDRWSSDADRDRLLNLIEQKGQDALLDALQKMPVVGYIRTPNSLRYDLHFARQESLPEGGRKVILATDRYIGMWEATNRPRSIDYPFTIIQLQLDKNNEGVGKASIATRVTKAKDGTIELEDFANMPVMLNDVKEAKSK